MGQKKASLNEKIELKNQFFFARFQRIFFSFDICAMCSQKQWLNKDCGNIRYNHIYAVLREFAFVNGKFRESASNFGIYKGKFAGKTLMNRGRNTYTSKLTSFTIMKIDLVNKILCSNKVEMEI